MAYILLISPLMRDKDIHRRREYLMALLLMAGSLFSGFKKLPKNLILRGPASKTDPGKGEVAPFGGFGFFEAPERNLSAGSGDGELLAVIYSPPSGDSLNPLGGVMVAYSTDGGNNWTSHVLSDNELYRAFSGTCWATGGDPCFAWQETYLSGDSLSTSLYFARDTSFPAGDFAVLPLPGSEEVNPWMPSLSARDSVILVSAVDPDENHISYIWRSIDGGASFVMDTLMTPGNYGDLGNWQDPPVIAFGRDGFVACINNLRVQYGDYEAVTPFYMESTDWGETWSEPLNLWDATGGIPYDSAGGWWYGYSLVVDTDNIPHAVWRFTRGDNEFGDIWEFHPTGGAPGNWSAWTRSLVVGVGDGTETASFPQISIDPVTNNLVVTYVKIDGASRTDPLLYYAVSEDGAQWYERGPLDTETPVWFETSYSSPYLPLTWPVAKGNLVYVSAAGGLFHQGWYIDYSPMSAKELTDLWSRNQFNIEFLGKRGFAFSFKLKEADYIDIMLYNIEGRYVRTLISGLFERGVHRLIWEGDERISAGVYIAALRGRKTGFITLKFILPL